MLRLIFSRIGNGVLHLYDNGHILVRSLLPFLLLLAGNLILGGCGVVGILIAAVIDIIAILVLYSSKKDLQQIVDTAVRLGRGDLDLKVDFSDMHGENRELAEAVNGIGDGIKTAVEKSMKDERLKADLITNVSHDIKTPLTSIINFVNLLKREQIDNERAKGYIQVLDAKSQRLKQLTDDLVEASKITSGNISLQMERLDFKELVKQTCGEFDDKLKEKCLEMIVSLPPEPVYIEADPRRIWRVVENLFSNVCKYALEGTRVYLEIRRVRQDDREIAVFTMKNISAQALNIRAEELTERFIRGDISRSTEGSGLGLSIAQNLTTLQKGTFEIYLDGDLFRRTAARYGENIRVLTAVGEGFVELVEEDREQSPEAEEAVRRVLEPMIREGADQIVLGCTHYPFLLPVFRQVIGERGVAVVDPSPAVGRRVGQLLDQYDLRAEKGAAANYGFLTFADEAYRSRLECKAFG